MADLVAKVALEKARYFLAQARDHSEGNDKFAFLANFEAAIIYSHSSLDHLHNEMAPKHNDKGYRRWHLDREARLKSSDPVFGYLWNRRNFIIHQEPEKTNTVVSIETELKLSMSVSLDMKVIRADGTVEHPNAPDPPPREQPQQASQSRVSRAFFFADESWRAKPALDYVADFIDVCTAFVEDADKRFSSV